jgi:hypothetical protein
MRLTTRTCHQCKSKFDIVEDGYFVKKPNRLVTIVNLLLSCIFVTVNLTVGQSKLICSPCNRDNKLKKLLK